MSHFPEVRLPAEFEPFLVLERSLGLVPRLFRAQSILPRVIEAEIGIAGPVLFRDGALTRRQKESILLAVAGARCNTYCVTAHAHILKTLGLPADRIDRIMADHRDAGLEPPDVALLDAALLLSRHPTWFGPRDIGRLRGAGFSDEAILEAVLTTGLADFLCTLSVGLGVHPDFDAWAIPARTGAWPPLARPGAVDGGAAAAGEPGTAGERGTAAERGTAGARTVPAVGRYLPAVELKPEEFPPFAYFRDRFGFVPNIFRAQTLRPDVLEAEARAVGSVLLTEDVLSRVQKEYVLLVVSAANLNTYCVAVHCEMLRALGVEPEASDRVAIDHRGSDLSPADKALLDFSLRLARRPEDWQTAGDIATLRGHRFSDAQIVEAIVMTGLASFLNTLQMGLAPEPDVPPLRVFPVEEGVGAAAGAAGADPASADAAAAAAPVPPDPDAELVERSRQGDLAAFGEIVQRHERRIFRILMGLTGHRDDALDAAQNAFVRAFERLAEFRGAARFATWLTRIAINEGLELVRGRRGDESLDDPAADETFDFKPGHLQPWQEDPERQYSRKEMRALVEEAIMGLPPVYRLPVILRDLEQLSTEEAAAVLGIGAVTLRTRLLLGRLLLREVLAPRFVAGRRGGPAGS